MAKIIQSATAQRRTPVKTTYASGVPVTNIFEVDLSDGVVAAEDIIEIGMVPNLAQITWISIEGVSVGAVTATIGMMDGEFGAPDATRVIETEIATGLTINNATDTVGKPACVTITPPTDNVGLGITLSGDVAAGAGKSIKVIMEHMAP